VPADALMGVKGRAWPALARVVERATVALCAEMCGGAQRVLDMTTDYAKIRVAFGNPIGTYQGVKLVQAFIPPSTVRFAPVMYEDSGPATNATNAATSSTCP
jgi:alkylation response protein AidB-like acyl-CoA dehydrogenase